MTRRVFLLIALLASLALAQERCLFCKSDTHVTNVPYAYGARPVCERCQTTLPKCDVCALVTNEKRWRDGRFLCAS